MSAIFDGKIMYLYCAVGCIIHYGHPGKRFFFPNNKRLRDVVNSIYS